MQTKIVTFKKDGLYTVCQFRVEWVTVLLYLLLAQLQTLERVRSCVFNVLGVKLLVESKRRTFSYTQNGLRIATSSEFL